jgi:hypothetical protein
MVARAAQMARLICSRSSPRSARERGSVRGEGAVSLDERILRQILGSLVRVREGSRVNGGSSAPWTSARLASRAPGIDDLRHLPPPLETLTPTVFASFAPLLAPVFALETA